MDDFHHIATALPSGLINDDSSDAKESLITGQTAASSQLKRRIWLNLSQLFATTFFLYMGIIPIALVQSSMNTDHGLGVTAMSVKHFGMVIGSFVAPSLIYKHGCKLSVVLGIALYIWFVPANFYPSWYTLIPAAVVSGIGYSIQAVAMKVYVARLARLYSSVSTVPEDRISSRFFVLLLVFVYFSNVGNLVGSFILNFGITNNMYKGTVRDVGVNGELEMCGARYCNQPLSSGNGNATSDGLDDVMRDRTYIFVGFCTLSSGLAVVLSMFLKPLAGFGIVSRAEDAVVSPLRVVWSVLRASIKSRYLLFVPMAVLVNGGESFWAADFNKAFITCSIGVSYVGYVSVWGGIGAALVAAGLAWFNKIRKFCIPMAVLTLVQLAIFVLLFIWKPYTQTVNYWMLSGFTVAFHAVSGVRNFVMPVLISMIFKEDLETAFAFYNFWLNMASAVFYFLSNMLCVSIKIYTLMGMALLSFITYTRIDFLVRNLETIK